MKKVVNLFFLFKTTFTFFFLMGFLFMLVSCLGMKARLKEAESHYEYGIMYLQNGKFTLAYNEFNKAVNLNPKDARAHNGLGLTYYFQGKFTQAVQEYEQAIQFDSLYADAYNNMAASLAKLEQWAEVIKYADKALAITTYATPEFAYYNKGLAYYHLNEFEKALAEFESSLEFDPNYIDTQYQLGLTLFQLRLYSRAVETFRQVLQLLPMPKEGSNDPLLIDSHYYLGLSCFHQNDKEGALKAFQKVIELDPAGSRTKEAQKYLDTLKMK